MIACSKWFQCGGGLTKLKFTRVKHLLVSAGLNDDGGIKIDWVHLVFTIAYQDLCCVTFASRKLTRRTETKIVTETAFHKKEKDKVSAMEHLSLSRITEPLRPCSVTIASRNW